MAFWRSAILIAACIGVLGLALPAGAQSRSNRTLSSPSLRSVGSSSVSRFNNYSYGVGNVQQNSYGGGAGALRSDIGRANTFNRQRMGTSLQQARTNPMASNINQQYTPPSRMGVGGNVGQPMNSPVPSGLGNSGIPTGPQRYETPSLDLSNLPQPRRMTQNRSGGMNSMGMGMAGLGADTDYSDMGKYGYIGSGGLGGNLQPSATVLPATGSSYYKALNAAKVLLPEDGSTTKPDAGTEPSAPIRTLSSEKPSLAQIAMKRGEEAFRNEEYGDAKYNFELALGLTLHSPESLLSLMNVHFATANGSYMLPSYYLQEAILKRPELLLQQVNPQDFYGRPATYIRDLGRLEEATLQNPNDADALFLLAYHRWREGKPEETRRLLARAQKAAHRSIEDDRKISRNMLNPVRQRRNLPEAIDTFWRSMVASGRIQGSLTDGSDASPPTPDLDSASGTEGNV